MFANTMMSGTCMAMPDTCKTPSPPAPPVPVPYPNNAMLNQANAGAACQKVFIMKSKALIIKTDVPMSTGDEAGAAGGVVSGCIKGAVKHTMGAIGVAFEGSPPTKLTSPSQHNGSNANGMGMTIAPSQTKVMIMK